MVSKMLLYRNRNSKRGKCGRMNDRIKELRELLPNCKNAKYRQSKATVLKVCIEYIKKLQIEYERFGKLEEKLRETILVYRGMLLRVQKLEDIMTMRSLTQNIANSSNHMDIEDEPNTKEAINTYSQNNSVMDHSSPLKAYVPTDTQAVELSPTVTGNFNYSVVESPVSSCPTSFRFTVSERKFRE